jgi:prevent-host-death family protein
MRTVSLMTANQEFSKLVREVERGEGFLITRRGRPVAKLVPHSTDKDADPAWAAAHRRMMARLEEGASLGGLRIERAALYERR